MASDRRATRLGVLAVVGAVLFSALGLRLWFLQTVESAGLQAQVDTSRTRTARIAPERGQIFDADGRLLAGNEPMINVVVSWDVLRRNADRAEIFTRLSGWVDVPVEEMEDRYDAEAYSPLKPMPVAEDVSEKVATAILERSEDFPGVDIETTYRRVYPFAPLASHVVGYMGAIVGEDEAKYKEQGYDTSNVGENVGRAGVELSYERTLHGEWGKAVYEIDSGGHVIRQLSYTPPVNGQDIQLAIDLDYQQYAERLLQTKLRIQRTWTAYNHTVKKPDGTRQRVSLNDGLYVNYKAPAGAVVVMDHSSGAVKAMASYPNYDPRWFSAEITKAKYKELFEPKDPKTGKVDNDKGALTNRAVQGQYNLGSTFKPFVSYAAMMSNINPEGPNWTYNDEGIYKSIYIDKERCDEGVKCQWRNATCGNGYPCRYGLIGYSTSLAVSSDAFFYALGEKFFNAPGYDRELLSQWISHFGFGSDTKIDLPFEWDGRVPTNENKAELVEDGVLAEGEVPRLQLGDVINMAIGQGLMAATPIQLAVGYGAIANNGKVMQPKIVQAIFAPNTPMSDVPGYGDLTKGKVVAGLAATFREIDMPEDVRAPIDSGLRRNILGQGTAANSTTAGELFSGQFYNGLDWTIPVAGKTGTAQGFGTYPWNDSSVFAAYSEDANNPYTVVTYLEKAGFGSRGAAPVVKCMFMSLANPAMLPAVDLADPLDLQSKNVADPEPAADTKCMAGSDADNVTPRPPQTNQAVD